MGHSDPGTPATPRSATSRVGCPRPICWQRRCGLRHRPGAPRPGRIHHCMRWLGIAAGRSDVMCDRANERVIAPDGSTLADRQVIQHWAAELDAEIRGARRRSTPHGRSISTAPRLQETRSPPSFSVANTMLRAVDTAIQVHGALGVTDDTVLSYWYRHERAARIYDGADEVHKTSLGRRILQQRKHAAS
ncbi:MAG: acyl-CoA dehydrogenase family protein [Acidimicrobiales bacterium]